MMERNDIKPNQHPTTPKAPKPYPRSERWWGYERMEKGVDGLAFVRPNPSPGSSAVHTNETPSRRAGRRSHSESS